MDRNPKFKWGRLALAASFLTVAFGVAIAVGRNRLTSKLRWLDNR